LILRRWDKPLSESGEKRAKLFKNNKYRKTDRQYLDHITAQRLPTIDSLKPPASCPKISAYAFRSFDRHWAIEDIRFNDRMGEALWRLQGEQQDYPTSLATEALGIGQGLIASFAVPDLHIFCGSGGKDVIPLYRDTGGSVPNVTDGLLNILSNAYGAALSAEDLAAYVYALLGGRSYTRRFWNELETPGPRVPLTKDAKVFADAAALGRVLIWLHTYAERFRGEGHGDEVPQGAARIVKGVSSDPAHYPAECSYDEAAREIVVGDGRFGPVTLQIWEFEVSGLKVVQSWLGYRMKKRAGKKSSPLDDIHPGRWTPKMSDELLELLWVLEATLGMEPELEQALDRAVAGSCFTAPELPQPKPEERRAPGTANAAGGLLEIMGVEDDEVADSDDA
jgi:hypothetical protein